MSRPEGISIRHNILLVASMGMLAFLIYFLFSNYLLNTNNRQMHDIQDVDVPLLQGISRIKPEFMRVRQSLQLAVSNSDLQELDNSRQLSLRLRNLIEGLALLRPEIKPQTDALLDTCLRYELETQVLVQSEANHAIPPQAFYAGISRIGALEEKFLQGQDAFEKQIYGEFHQRLADSRQGNDKAQSIGLGLGFAAMLVLGLISWVASNVNKSLVDATQVADAITRGHWDVSIDTRAGQQSGRLMHALSMMRDTLRLRMEEDHHREQRKTKLAELHEQMRGDLRLPVLCQNVLNYLAPVLGMQMGAFYVRQAGSEKLRLISGYAIVVSQDKDLEFVLGESWVGQAALSRKTLIMNHIPEDYAEIRSGIGATSPRNVMVVPIMLDDEVLGVLELSSLHACDAEAETFLNECLRSIAVALVAAESRAKLSQALERSRSGQMEEEPEAG